MSHNKNITVLFVCLGNICRSPAAAAMLCRMIEKTPLKGSMHVESCGLGNWHIGQFPDERMRKRAKKRGLNLSSRARVISQEDFQKFDFILAADFHVKHELEHLSGSSERIYLITDFSAKFKGQDIPDPFYEDEACFDEVLDILEDACSGFLDHILKQLQKSV